MSDLIISIEQGQLQGKISPNLRNNNFYSFQGIPYAKPPVDDLRFKTPEPPEPWVGVRDATKEGNISFCRDLITQQVDGSEDCLFLNVYTPELPTQQRKSLKPVMVWIHGGAFRSGSGNTSYFGPEFLLTEDIVLVTLNYRLGIFGFLQFDDSSLEVLGNAGLKDVVLALKWVQKNIAHFSGDPNNVTIFGESAGGVSVHHLVLSPLAKGLFHRAIVQSGTAINAFGTARDDIITHLSNILQLKTEKEIHQHLINLSTAELFEVYEKVLKSCEGLGNSRGRLSFGPLIEKPSPYALISEDPIKIIKSGTYNKVPIIFGYTTKEGMLMEQWVRPRKPTMPQNFEATIPHVLGVEPGSELSRKTAERVKQYYYSTPDLETDVEAFYTFHTDNSFVRDIIFAAQFHAANSQLPVYLYRVSIDTSLNFFKRLLKITSPGVCHADELGYLFKNRVTPTIVPGSLEEASIIRFVKFWTHFAKTGNPNSGELEDVPQWQPIVDGTINFIDIGPEVVAHTNPESKMMSFWKDIFKMNQLYSS